MSRVNKEFVCIQQFRPAMYFGASDLSKQTIKNPDFGYWYAFDSNHPLIQCSYELCAGLLDKPNRTKEQAIVDEIREELGYEVSLDQLEFVGRSRSQNSRLMASSRSSWHVRIAHVHVLRGSNA